MTATLTLPPSDHELALAAQPANEAPRVVCTSIRCSHPRRRFNCGHRVGESYIRHEDCIYTGDGDRCDACLVARPLAKGAEVAALTPFERGDAWGDFELVGSVRDLRGVARRGR